MESFIQGLLHGLKTPLAKRLLQDPFLLWLQFDCHCDTIPRLGRVVNSMISYHSAMPESPRFFVSSFVSTRSRLMRFKP